MKICPSCRRTYDDDGLNFCLEDGSVLTLAGNQPAPTVVMEQQRTTSPSPGTGVRTSWDAQNAGAYSMQPKKKSSKTWLWVVGILGLVIIVCGGGFAGFFIYVASIANTNANNNSMRGAANSSANRSNRSPSGSPDAPPAETMSFDELDLAAWVREFSVWGTTEFKDGEFLMAAKEKGYYYVLVAPDEYSTERAVTRVTVRNPDDVNSSLGYGLIFHSDPTPLTKDYAFLIDTKRKKFRVVRHDPERETTVTPWTSSKLINGGTEENVLEIRDRGDKFELYINGQLATTVVNKQGPTSGVPGLYAGDGAKIAFKKLEIAKPAAAN